MSKDRLGPKGEDFDEEELIKSEFEPIISGLSLDESTQSSYLDDLERIERADRFVPPNPPSQSPRSFFISAKNAVERWLKRAHHNDDGVEL